MERCPLGPDPQATRSLGICVQSDLSSSQNKPMSQQFKVKKQVSIRPIKLNRKETPSRRIHSYLACMNCSVEHELDIGEARDGGSENE